jgi:replicative DNA helicase
MGLKAIAKEHGVGIMALAQLSRSVEQRTDKRPIMADLRESGQIEQDADAIMFLYRPEYYLHQAEPPAHDAKHCAWEQACDEARGKIEFIVAKRRRGRTGTCEGRFYGAFQAVRG